MASVFERIPGRLAALGSSAVMLVALGGCQLKHPTANLITGKQLFVSKCGSCHTLSHAGSVGQTGPNLDDAFRQDRVDGVKGSSIEGLVAYWIHYPNSQGVMPANCSKHSPFCLTGQQAEDIAGYIAKVAAVSGQDSGSLASAVQQVNQKPVAEQNGKLEIDADPTGQLKFLALSATATAGPVTIDMKNTSSTPHDIAISGNGVSAVGKIVSNGGVSTVSATLKPGTYTFFCTVPGHEAAGMKGTITVK
jgi:plastocyanin